MSKAAEKWAAAAHNVLIKAVDELAGINSLPKPERPAAIRTAIYAFTDWPGEAPPMGKPGIIEAVKLVETANFLLMQTVINPKYRGRHKWDTVTAAAAILADAMELIETFTRPQ